MADDAIERSHEIFGRLGWKYNGAKYTWRSPAGARLRFRPLERVTDAEKYQGQNITDACVEEAGNFPDPKPIDRLNGVLRSAHGVPTQLILTGNPGGPGQGWIKERYIEPEPKGMKIYSRELPNGEQHKFVFIPSKLQNNRILHTRDPGYVNRLYMVGSAELVRAWLEGDWDAIEGAFFDCWRREKHVLAPFEIPEWWARFRSLDWGSARPFSVGWWAVASEETEHQDHLIPRGAMIRYREWYGKKKPNVGLKLTVEQVADGIVERSGNEKYAYSVADPSIFSSDGGPSHAERFFKKKVSFKPADNKRIPSVGHMGGWDQMRARLIGDGEGAEPGTPMIFCFDTCADSIRTIPALQHDDLRPEDLEVVSQDVV